MSTSVRSLPVALSLFLAVGMAACDDSSAPAADAGHPDAIVTPPDAETPDACAPLPAELCGNGVDDDCNGAVDDGCAAPGSLLWARQAGGSSSSEQGRGIATTSDGGVIAVGIHRGDAVFGAGEVNETTLTAEPTPISLVGYAARHASDGQLLWAKRIVVTTGIAETVTVNAVSTDAEDGFVVAGSFEGTVLLGPDAESPVSSGADPTVGAFIASFDAEGNLRWANVVDGTSFLWGLAVRSLPSGEVVLAGTYDGQALFRGGDAEMTVGTAGSGVWSAYVAWYGPDGTLLSVASARSDFDSQAFALTDRPGGGIYVTGELRGPTTFGDGADEVELDGAYRSVFVAAYDAEHALSWARIAADGNIDVRGIATASGHVYLVGELASTTAVFGPGQPGEVDIPYDSGGAFVADLDGDGSFAWVRIAASGSTGPVAFAAAATADGVAITGRVAGRTVFGAGEPGEVALMVADVRETFVARYRADGTFLWAKSIVAPGSYNGGYAITRRSDDTFVVTGEFEATAVFGPGEAHETSLSATGQEDIFVAAFAP